MYCVRCGKQVPDADSFCVDCGEPTRAAIPFSSVQSRFGGSLGLIGAACIVISVLRMMPGVAQTLLFHGGVPSPGIPGLADFGSVALLASGVLGIFIGVRLLRRQSRACPSEFRPRPNGSPAKEHTP